MSTIINATTTNGVVIQPDNSGSLVLQTNNGTAALTIDTSQNITTTNKLASASMPTGSVLQVVNATYSTQTSTTTNTYIDTGLTATITPKFSTSKILVIVDVSDVGKDTNNTYVSLRLLRGATSILTFTNQAGWTSSTASNDVGSCSANYLDSPATTSATTYKVQFNSVSNNANVYVMISNSTSTITLMEIAV
jgi:hypothetical protein